jgi:hypothetical protein
LNKAQHLRLADQDKFLTLMKADQKDKATEVMLDRMRKSQGYYIAALAIKVVGHEEEAMTREGKEADERADQTQG